MQLSDLEMVCWGQSSGQHRADYFHYWRKTPGSASQGLWFLSFAITLVGTGIAVGLLCLLCAPFPHTPVTKMQHSVPLLLSGSFLYALMLWTPQTVSAVSATQEICHTLEWWVSAPRLKNSLKVTKVENYIYLVCFLSSVNIDPVPLKVLFAMFCFAIVSKGRVNPGPVTSNWLEEEVM